MAEFFRSLNEIVDPRHTCLVVIDMQNDFCAPKGFMDREGQKLDLIRAMIPNLRVLLQNARANRIKIVYFKNTHDDEHINPGQLELDHRKGRIPERTFPNTWGWEIIPELTPVPSDKVICKYRYSGLTSEDFKNYLKDNAIRSLVITGVGTAVCVESTVRDAFMADYYVVVAKDCVAAYTKEVHEFSLRIMDRNFARVATSSEIAGCWDGAS